MDKLSEAQENVLNAIKKLLSESNIPPTVREIGKASNLSSSSTIHHHLESLEKKGFIKRNDNKSRTLELLVPNEYLNNKNKVISVPFITEKVKNIRLFLDIPDNFYTIPTSMVDNKENLLVVEVTKDLVTKGLSLHDILIIEKKNKYEDKDKVLVLDKNDIKLETFDKDKYVLGKVIGIYRKI